MPNPTPLPSSPTPPDAPTPLDEYAELRRMASMPHEPWMLIEEDVRALAALLDENADLKRQIGKIADRRETLVYCALQRHGLTLEQANAKTDDELMRLRAVGPKVVEAIRAVAARAARASAPDRAPENANG